MTTTSTLQRKKKISYLRRRIAAYRRKIAAALKQIKVLRRRPKPPVSISPRGIKFISEFEGFEPRPAPDPVGYCSIGFGHLIRYGPCRLADHNKYGTLTREQGLDLLREDLAEYSAAVRDLVSVPLTQSAFDALVSFAYNLGISALADSTLLKVINTSRGDLKGNEREIREQFSRWINAGVPPKPLPGLVRRRRAEADLFFLG